MDEASVKFLSVAITMFGACIAAGLGLGKVFSSWLEGISRNPSADSKISKVGFIAFAGTELVLLLGFVVALMLFNK